MKKELSLADLKKRTETYRDRLRAYQKERYDLARELGFSSAEAAILQNQKRETIIRLAEENNQLSSP